MAREETRCHHMGYSFWLAAMVLLYASSHRQDNTHHSLCYTSHGALAGTRNSSMGPSRRINLMTHRSISERSYHRATSRSLLDCARWMYCTKMWWTVSIHWPCSNGGGGSLFRIMNGWEEYDQCSRDDTKQHLPSYTACRRSVSLSGLTWPSCVRCVCILLQCKNECQSLRTDLTIMCEVCLHCIPVSVSQDWLDHHVWGVFALYSSARMSASLSGPTWPSCVRCVCILFQCKNECQSLRTDLAIMSEVCLHFIPV